MRNMTRYIAAALGCLLLTGCAGQQSNVQHQSLTGNIQPQAVAGKPIDDPFTAAQYGFSVKLLQETAAERKGENILISPYSVMHALAMTANGAGGGTQKEMEQTLGGIPVGTLNQYLLTQRQEMPDSEDSRFRTANSVWLRDDGERLQVRQDFLQTLRDYYAADAFARPFDEPTRKEINQWCSDQTDGMIPEMLTDPISSDAVMFLINAICFDAKWARAYKDEPSGMTFTAYGGASQNVQMMYSDESQYLSDNHAEGFIKPYRSGYVFAALLPEEGLSAEDYLASLTDTRLHDILTGAEQCDVRAGLPKFSYDFDIEYNKILSDMGMAGAFTPGADFSNMADTASGMLFIGSVLHKTHIDVDTEGTKAAAVTAVMMKDEDAVEETEPKTVILDRPFVYFIADAGTMTPVFAGVVNSAAE